MSATSKRDKTNKRLLPRKAAGGVDRGKQITHEEIAEAIRAFRKQGGLIQKLPSQPDTRRRIVGNHWDSTYESVIEH